MRRAVPYILLAAALTFGGCRREPAPNSGTPTAAAPAAEAAPSDSAEAPDSILVGDPPIAVPGPLTAPPSEWTTNTTSVQRGTGTATHTGIRTAGHTGFDRVVLEFGADVPGYHIEYIDRPTYACGSGEAVYLAGDAWLLVRLQPAQAHTEAGAATISERRHTFDLPILREAAMTCDFEADVSWVFGVASPNGYVVAELSKPTRLVIDLRH